MHKLLIFLAAALFYPATYAKDTFPELTAERVGNINSKASQQNIQSTLSQDFEVVMNFMKYNGGYVLALQNSKKRVLKLGEALSKSSNPSDRNEIAAQGMEEEKQRKRLKGLMVEVNKNPEDWTIEDLQKLKVDPKSAEMFQALVRVRDAIYGDGYSEKIKSYLINKLQNVMPDQEPMTESELHGLLDRVKIVRGGNAAYK